MSYSDGRGRRNPRPAPASVEAAPAPPEPAPIPSHLVAVTKGGDVLHVHPELLDMHRRLGWKPKHGTD